MKTRPLSSGMLARIATTACFLSITLLARAADPVPGEVSAALKRSADWHLANPSGIEVRNWIIAPLYDGLLRTALATGDAKYLAAVIRFGNQAGWMPANRPYHADDHAVGHAWLDIYLMDTSRKERLEPMRDRLSRVIDKPITEALARGRKPETRGIAVTDRWTWCDALYMAPPTLTRLFTATGDRKYLEFLDREFRITYDDLYDPAERLFFRDATFIEKKTPSGKKTFWSRGNGWVYGGIALLLEHLPTDHPTRGFYEKLFKDMTTAVLAAQQPDGLWYPSMLDSEEINLGETSGSGFFTFGLAWGVNHGLLDRATHWPAISRGWAGLLTRTRPDGYVGYVQPVGAAPDKLDADSIQDYGTGAFLLAGSEILRSLGAASRTQPPDLLKAADAILAAEAKTPRAYARLVPERMDDLAWENDKVAFRIYGPALRKGPEDSGIDVWCKRVPYPVLDKWYENDRVRKISYHKDNGEGFDGYHVGDTRGCGGVGLWVDGKLVTADTYQSAGIIWTKPDVAEFRTVYRYPLKIDKKPVVETRITRLSLGQRLFEVTSVFSNKDASQQKNPQSTVNSPYEVAIGVVTQDKGATITLASETGIIAVHEPLAGKGLGTGVIVDPRSVIRTETLPATDKDRKHEQAVVFVRPDEKGRIVYRAGFAWAGDGEITTPAQWLEYLKQQAGK
jgi:unsaturated rhamnogalacturonyl hydrolase